MDALTLEEYTCRTWPTLETVELDGWLLRFGGGVTGRSNAVYPLYPSKRDVPEKIAQVETHYQRRNLPPNFKLASPLHQTLDVLLDQHGYELYNRSLVMARPLAGGDVPEPTHFVTIEAFSEAWLADYGRINAARAAQLPVMGQLLTAPVGQRVYASVWADGQRVAVGVLSWARAYGGLYCMATDPAHRGQGMAQSVAAALLSEAVQRGVKTAFLQVEAQNQPALAVYRRSGFTEAYPYHYRRKPAEG